MNSVDATGAGNLTATPEIRQFNPIRRDSYRENSPLRDRSVERPSYGETALLEDRRVGDSQKRGYCPSGRLVGRESNQGEGWRVKDPSQAGGDDASGAVSGQHKIAADRQVTDKKEREPDGHQTGA